MRILVTNSDGPGGLIGAQLAAAGRDITLLDRTARAFDLDFNPLVVKSPLGNYQGRPDHIEPGEITGVFDLIIVAARAHEIDALVQVLPRAVGAGTIILPFVTGLEHIDLLRDACPDAVMLDGQHDIAVQLDEQGVVNHSGGQQIRVSGSTTVELEAATKIAGLFANTKLDVRLSRCIERQRWQRCVMAVGAAGLAALMRARVTRLLENDTDANHLWQLIGEASMIAAAAGHPVDVAAMAEFTEQLPHVVPAPLNQVLADADAGDFAEITELVEQMQRLARKTNSPAPLLDVVATALLARSVAIRSEQCDPPQSPAPGRSNNGWFGRRYASRAVRARR